MRKLRGTALIVVLFVVLAISLLGAAIVVVSGRHLSSARQRETSVGLSSCAMAVRQYLASQVAAGTPLSSLDFTIPATGTPITLKGGHYDNVNVTSFTLSGGPAFGVGGGSSVENLANAMPMALGVSANQRTGTAVCTTYADSNSQPRTYEVEFSFIAP